MPGFAAWAVVHLAAQDWGTTGRDRPHETALPKVQSMLCLQCFSVTPDDIRDFESWLGRIASVGRPAGLDHAHSGRKEPQRIRAASNHAGGHMQVALRTLDARVAQQSLDHSQVSALLKHQRGIRVAQGMGSGQLR